MPSVAVIGASSDRTKFSNKSVRAHLKAGYTVYPVHPRETEIENIPVFPSIRDVPGSLDRVTLYIPPSAGLLIIDDIARKNPKELFFNPGTANPELLERAKALGLNVVEACSIVDLGFHASEL
jgi:predicted CoA-binding protein